MNKAPYITMAERMLQPACGFCGSFMSGHIRPCRSFSDRFTQPFVDKKPGVVSVRSLPSPPLNGAEK